MSKIKQGVLLAKMYGTLEKNIVCLISIIDKQFLSDYIKAMDIKDLSHLDIQWVHIKTNINNFHVIWANLSNVTFSDCSITNTEFISCTMDNISFVWVMLKKASFTDLSINWWLFNNSTLDEVIFRNIISTSTKFTSSRIKTTTYDSCYLDKNSFTFSDFKNVKMPRTIRTDCTPPNWYDDDWGDMKE